MVLGTAMIVTVIGLSALMALRVERRSTEGIADFAQARLHAQSAVEMGFHRIASDPDWRTTYPSGVWEADRPIGTGTYTLEGVDPDDNNLNDSDADPLVLTGIGTQGEARYKLQVTLVAEYDPLACLDVALHAGNDLVFDGVTLQCDQTISANNSATADGSDIYSALEVVNTIGGSGTFWDPPTTGITPRTMPDPMTVFDSYVAGGTAINLFSLPASIDETVRYLKRIVLSPASNPYGATNPKGVYVIDCLGISVILEDCRIVGTLVLRNPGSATGIFRPVNWEPAVANYPALMVEGDFAFKTFDTQLSEASTGVNFNPAGTPYLAASDDTMDDTYPSLISGIVYVSNDATDDSSFTRTAVNGVWIVGNTLTAIASSSKDPIYFDLTYDSRYRDNPPPGFRGPAQVVVSPGTWRQVVD